MQTPADDQRSEAPPVSRATKQEDSGNAREALQATIATVQRKANESPPG
jgi:hypothetical protein